MMADPEYEVRRHVVQGEHSISDHPGVMLTTILGSCVAACIRDPKAGVGGMNHFLLPGEGREGGGDIRFGVYAMEVLINALLRAGARRERLEAKLFGGGRLVRGLSDIGEANASFARDFLEKEGIAFLGGSLGGDCARRVQFWPVSGVARQSLLQREQEHVFIKEAGSPAPKQHAGELELF